MPAFYKQPVRNGLDGISSLNFFYNKMFTRRSSRQSSTLQTLDQLAARLTNLIAQAQHRQTSETTRETASRVTFCAQLHGSSSSSSNRKCKRNEMPRRSEVVWHYFDQICRGFRSSRNLSPFAVLRTLPPPRGASALTTFAMNQSTPSITHS